MWGLTFFIVFSSFSAKLDIFKINHLKSLIHVPRDVSVNFSVCFLAAEVRHSCYVSEWLHHLHCPTVVLWEVRPYFRFYQALPIPANLCYISSAPNPYLGHTQSFPDTDLAPWFLAHLHPNCLYFLSTQRRACFCSSCRNACFSISFRNSPCLLPSSSVCWPHSATRCWSSTATAFAFWIVDRRWAMTTTVLPVDWGGQENNKTRQKDGSKTIRQSFHKWMQFKRRGGRLYPASDAPTLPGPVTRSRHPMHWVKIRCDSKQRNKTMVWRASLSNKCAKPCRR